MLSPFYYFHGLGVSGVGLRYFDLHFFRQWESMRQITLHSAIVTAMGVLVLEVGARRLSSSLRN